MSDPRSTPDTKMVTQNLSQQVGAVFGDLMRHPTGPRDRQLLFGQAVTVLGVQGDHAYVRAERDGYHGYFSRYSLRDFETPTHLVSAPCTHVYEAPDFKSRDLLALSHLSRITAQSETKKFVQTEHGYIPRQHLEPASYCAKDPAKIAEHYLGTDYLWGGNSRWGIDCSGLVQAALLACALPCPGDSDQQMTLGAPATEPYKRNDLLFWKGHVALVTDPDTLIHANAHSMSVTYEPIKAAIDRIAQSGDGPVTAHRRLSPSFWP